MHKVAIVDYGLGNLYSIQNACRSCGLNAFISDDKKEIVQADALILPGVGAFGDAMNTLRSLDMVSPIRDFAQSGKPLLGICLGIQLLLTESCEFGIHKGLDIVPGQVVPLNLHSSQPMRIPQVGWNRLQACKQPWEESFLSGLRPDDYLYFVHSFVAVPSPDAILSTTQYVGSTFCSSLQQGNVFACQFHPERSGPSGLKIYKNLALQLEKKTDACAVE